jgi:hypothetical protein
MCDLPYLVYYLVPFYLVLCLLAVHVQILKVFLFPVKSFQQCVDPFLDFLVLA